MTVLEVLENARGLIAKGWTQYAMARDKDGQIIPFNSLAAVCFCAAGAVLRSSQQDDKANDGALKVLSGVIAGGTAPKFNDEPDTTQADVLEAFDRAIAVAKEESI